MLSYASLPKRHLQLCPPVPPLALLIHDLLTLAAAGGGGTGAMAPPLAREGGAILSFGPTIDVKGKR